MGKTSQGETDGPLARGLLPPDRLQVLSGILRAGVAPQE